MLCHHWEGPFWLGAQGPRGTGLALGPRAAGAAVVTPAAGKLLSTPDAAGGPASSGPGGPVPAAAAGGEAQCRRLPVASPGPWPLSPVWGGRRRLARTERPRWEGRSVTTCDRPEGRRSRGLRAGPSARPQDICLRGPVTAPWCIRGGAGERSRADQEDGNETRVLHAMADNGPSVTPHVTASHERAVRWRSLCSAPAGAPDQPDTAR